MYVYFGERTSWRALAACLTISVGFLLGIGQQSEDETSLKIGVVYGVLSSLFCALNGVYIKKSLTFVEGNLFKLNFWLNVYSMILLTPLIFLNGEHETLVQFNTVYRPSFWLWLAMAGLLGLLVGFVTSLQIELTSPLTHNISGIGKSCVQTVLGNWSFTLFIELFRTFFKIVNGKITLFYQGVIVYMEVRSFVWWLSNVLVLVGAAYYSYERNKEMRNKHRQHESILEFNTVAESRIGAKKYTLPWFLASMLIYIYLCSILIAFYINKLNWKYLIYFINIRLKGFDFIASLEVFKCFHIFILLYES